MFSVALQGWLQKPQQAFYPRHVLDTRTCRARSIWNCMKARQRSSMRPVLAANSVPLSTCTRASNRGGCEPWRHENCCVAEAEEPMKDVRSRRAFRRTPRAYLILPDLEGGELIQRHIDAVALAGILAHITQNVGQLVGSPKRQCGAVHTLQRALQERLNGNQACIKVR